MAYTSKDYESKAEIKRALKAGVEITVYQPGAGTVPVNGKIGLEGPHFPRPHKWYGTGMMKDGKLVSIR